MNPIKRLRRIAGLTQAALAARAGTSQPTVAAYESGRKSPRLDTVQRLAGAAGLEAIVEFHPPLTREERRSLELHREIAERLSDSPERVRARARENLARMRTVAPHASDVLDEWASRLDGPAPALLRCLTDPHPWARELRHVSPFGGVLTAAERAAVYERFRESEGRRAS